MSKPTLVYAVVLVACVGGLWGILRAGSHLSAVSDLTGQWTIEDGPQGPSGLQQLGGAFAVEQSGQFIRVRFKGGQALDLRAETAPMGPIDKPVTLVAAGGGARLTGTIGPVTEGGPGGAGTSDDDDAKKDLGVRGRFTLTGPTVARFVAFRAPARADAKPGH